MGLVRGDGPLFAALALAADVRAGAESDVAAVEQADELGDPQPGLGGEQRAGRGLACLSQVAPVGSGQQGVELGRGEEADGGLGEALGRDGQDPRR